MFETLKRLYGAGRITETELRNAIARGWITEAQAREITGGKV